MSDNKILIFDIGANKGNFSKKYIEKCRIVAAEPNPVLIKEIKNTFLNQDLIIEECAASNKNGEIDFYICLDDQMSSCNKDWLTVLRYKNAGIREKIKVKTITLDSLIEKHGIPYHIKIDVEGYEAEVLNGLNKKIKSIQFEYIKENFEDLTVPAILRLKEIGYSKFKINDSKPVKLEISKNDIIKIQEKNSLDMEIYEYVRKSEKR